MMTYEKAAYIISVALIVLYMVFVAVLVLN
jgi:hypothetical protein